MISQYESIRICEWCGGGGALPSKCINMILLPGIQLSHGQRYLGSTVKMVFSFKIFAFHDNRSQITVVKTVELTGVVYHVSES
jgi:hypothetical protein